MAIAIALVLIVVGSVLFHMLSPWWWTPIASNWSYIDHTLVITFWITGLVFAAVVLFTAYCVFRFRHREGARADYEPENRKLESWLTVATAVGVAAMLTPGLVVWKNFVTVPETAAEVEVVAQQWFWSYRLPGADGVLGRSDSKLISFENPLGVVPDDANGADDVIIESADPEVVYVPTYNPTVVYGAWPYPAYPPYHYYPPGYAAGGVFFGFTVGVIVGGGGCCWGGYPNWAPATSISTSTTTSISTAAIAVTLCKFRPWPACTSSPARLAATAEAAIRRSSRARAVSLTASA